MGGDRIPSRDVNSRFFLGCASVVAVAALVLLVDLLFGAVKCLVLT